MTPVLGVNHYHFNPVHADLIEKSPKSPQEKMDTLFRHKEQGGYFDPDSSNVVTSSSHSSSFPSIHSAVDAVKDLPPYDPKHAYRYKSYSPDEVNITRNHVVSSGSFYGNSPDYSYGNSPDYAALDGAISNQVLYKGNGKLTYQGPAFLKTFLTGVLTGLFDQTTHIKNVTDIWSSSLGGSQRTQNAVVSVLSLLGYGDTEDGIFDIVTWYNKFKGEYKTDFLKRVNKGQGRETCLAGKADLVKNILDHDLTSIFTFNKNLINELVNNGRAELNRVHNFCTASSINVTWNGYTPTNITKVTPPSLTYLTKKSDGTFSLPEKTALHSTYTTTARLTRVDGGFKTFVKNGRGHNTCYMNAPVVQSMILNGNVAENAQYVSPIDQGNYIYKLIDVMKGNDVEAILLRAMTGGYSTTNALNERLPGADSQNAQNPVLTEKEKSLMDTVLGNSTNDTERSEKLTTWLTSTFCIQEVVTKTDTDLFEWSMERRSKHNNAHGYANDVYMAYGLATQKNIRPHVQFCLQESSLKTRLFNITGKRNFTYHTGGNMFDKDDKNNNVGKAILSGITHEGATPDSGHYTALWGHFQ